MEENNNKQQGGYHSQEEYMQRIRESRQLFRVEIKRIMEEETGDAYEVDQDLLAVFNSLSADKQQTINGRINLLQKFSTPE
ncbi:MAG: hypothetical protein JKY03_12640 [Aureispira sp.]|nr:hypothetical protein [Aureispira sp.]